MQVDISKDYEVLKSHGSLEPHWAVCTNSSDLEAGVIRAVILMGFILLYEVYKKCILTAQHLPALQCLYVWEAGYERPQMSFKKGQQEMSTKTWECTKFLITGSQHPSRVRCTCTARSIENTAPQIEGPSLGNGLSTPHSFLALPPFLSCMLTCLSLSFQCTDANEDCNIHEDGKKTRHRKHSEQTRNSELVIKNFLTKKLQDQVA